MPFQQETLGLSTAFAGQKEELNMNLAKESGAESAWIVEVVNLVVRRFIISSSAIGIYPASTVNVSF